MKNTNIVWWVLALKINNFTWNAYLIGISYILSVNLLQTQFFLSLKLLSIPVLGLGFYLNFSVKLQVVSDTMQVSNTGKECATKETCI
jgi:hypothetical protein